MGEAEEGRFESDLDALSNALGHADRDGPFRWYTTGLLLALERKSVEPIAARADPGRTSAVHLHHVVAKAEWSDEALLRAVRQQIVPILETGYGRSWWMRQGAAYPR